MNDVVPKEWTLYIPNWESWKGLLNAAPGHIIFLSFFHSYSDLCPPPHCRCRVLLLHRNTLSLSLSLSHTHTHKHTHTHTLGRTPLDEWSARRTNDTQQSQKRDQIGPGGIRTCNPKKSERPQTQYLDGATTGIGYYFPKIPKYVYHYT